jgi:GWxTD domain-containing protein
MRRILAVPAAVMVFALAAAPGREQQGGEEPLTVRAMRFYRPLSATTTIEGVCEVRLPALLGGVGQAARYQVEIAVLDSTGLELQRSERSREVPPAFARSRGATALESFGFPVAPGRYSVRVRVVPGSGAAVERLVRVEGYGSPPLVSDLVLATGARMAASDSEALSPGEVRRGALVLQTAPAPRLTPSEATLSYYAEVYPWGERARTAELTAEVVAPDGRVLVHTPARSVEIASTGGATQGALDLTGLPEGGYSLRLRLRFSDTTVVDEASFSMASLASLAAQPPPAVDSTADLFEGADQARLDSLFAPLVDLAEQSGQLSQYRNLTVEGKRRWLRDFWQQRDPTPGTRDNPARDQFYRGVAYANGAFREGGAGQMAGWNTDRGRVYLRNGRPDETMRRPAASPRPFEAWKFTREQMRWYVFLDETGLGHYVLIGTNDRRETGRMNWEVMLGRSSVVDVYSFLGLPLSGIQQNP